MLKKPKSKNFCIPLLNPKPVLAAIFLVLLISVPGYLFGTGRANTGSRMILLSATVSNDDIVGQPGSNDPGEWQTIQMRVTAYCACPKCCGRYSDGITASGHKIGPGDFFVAADKRYPFGTEIIIEGYSNGEPVKVLDRGGAIRRNRLDVFFSSHHEALQWGVRYLNVQIRR